MVLLSILASEYAFDWPVVSSEKSWSRSLFQIWLLNTRNARRTLVGPHVVDRYERHLKAVGAQNSLAKLAIFTRKNSDGISWDSKGSNGLFLEDFWLAELVEITPRLYGDYNYNE